MGENARLSYEQLTKPDSYEPHCSFIHVREMSMGVLVMFFVWDMGSREETHWP